MLKCKFGTLHFCLSIKYYSNETGLSPISDARHKAHIKNRESGNLNYFWILCYISPFIKLLQPKFFKKLLLIFAVRCSFDDIFISTKL